MTNVARSRAASLAEPAPVTERTTSFVSLAAKAAGFLAPIVFDAESAGVRTTPNIPAGAAIRNIPRPWARPDFLALVNVGRRPSRSPSPGQRPGERDATIFLFGPTGQSFVEGLARWADTTGSIGSISPGRCPGLGEPCPFGAVRMSASQIATPPPLFLWLPIVFVARASRLHSAAGTAAPQTPKQSWTAARRAPRRAGRSPPDRHVIGLRET
jgi:hypothetical protein